MVRVYLKFNGTKWEIVDKSDFWIDKFLLQRLDSLKMIQKKGWDGLIIIDGPERSGKSTLAMIMGWYLSNTKLTEKNFASGLSDAGNKIGKLPDGSVLVVDEGSILFGSKDSQTNEQKRLIKLLDVVGQKNLIFIVCLPSFFDLNKTIAVRRSKFLLHVYPDKNYNRGNFVCFSERKKGILYRYGKKHFDSYAFPSPGKPSSFFDFNPPFYDAYLEKVKKKSLQEVLDGAMKVNASITTINTAFKKKMLQNMVSKQLKITQSQVALMWGVDDAVVSRLINQIKSENMAIAERS